MAARAQGAAAQIRFAYEANSEMKSAYRKRCDGEGAAREVQAIGADGTCSVAFTAGARRSGDGRKYQLGAICGCPSVGVSCEIGAETIGRVRVRS